MHWGGSEFKANLDFIKLSCKEGRKRGRKKRREGKREESKEGGREGGNEGERERLVAKNRVFCIQDLPESCYVKRLILYF